jgi:hypothetical protein
VAFFIRELRREAVKSMEETNMDIQILHGGQQIGPYSEEAVHALLKEGRVLVNDLAWRPGLTDWVPLVHLLYPAASQPPAPPAPVPTETPAPAPPPREPATARQKALLDYLGIAFAPDVTKEDASQLVNEAMEHPKDPARLARWNEERLHLHPELFAAEIQAKKENRSQHYLEVCHEAGAPYFEKVTKAHCQVLVGHLDVHSPHWDANEREAAEKYFFPAIAEKFPQLMTEAGKAKFKSAEKPSAAAKKAKSAPAAVKTRPSSSPGVGKIIYALARGVFIGLLILGLLWIGRGFFTPKPAAVKKGATAANTTEVPASAEPAPAPAPATSTTSPTPPEATTAQANPPEKPSEPPAAPPAAVTAEPAMAATDMKAAPAGTDLPLFGAPPAAAAPSLIPASPTRTSVILTKAIQITLPFGKISVPPGTTVKIVAQNGAALTVRYLDHEVTIPASSTDLGTDPANAPTAATRQ